MGLCRATWWVPLVVVAVLASAAAAGEQLTPGRYDVNCPRLQSIVRRTMKQAVNKEQRMGASILRLFFHDCFVNGCDASVLLDDDPGRNFKGEKTAFPNVNSLRGYEVIDAVKALVEAACPGIVSCADILALAARDAVKLLGGPSWKVALGRHDARTASQDAVTTFLPSPGSDVATLLSKFGTKGLDARDLTALSGAHTVGQARCVNFRDHIYDDPTADAAFAAGLRGVCPRAGGDGNLAPLEAQKPDTFDNGYFSDLLARRVLLKSDQALFGGGGGATDAIVRAYAANKTVFFNDFVNAMVKMGGLRPSAETGVEVRRNCRRVN